MRSIHARATTHRADTRGGFTLVEVVLALTLLSGVVLMLSMGTTKFQRSVGDSNIRSSRARPRGFAAGHGQIVANVEHAGDSDRRCL